jgi:glucan phosphoethanolaminetransferase (alkaline phosphatase superfamily)
MSHSNFRSPKLWLVAVCYSLLSLVPWFGLFSGQSPDQPLMLLALTLTSWAGMWALAGSLRWLHWIMLPAVLLLPVEIYLRQFYGQGISTHHLGIIAETSPREAAEFLGSKLWLAAALLLTLTGFWFLLWRQIKALGWLPWRHWSRWPALIFAFIPLFLFYTGTGSGATRLRHFCVRQRTCIQSTPTGIRPQLARQSGRPLPNWLRPPFDEELAMRSWPFGLILRGADFWNERMYLEQLSEKSRVQLRCKRFFASQYAAANDHGHR